MHDEVLNIGIANGIKNGYKGQAAYLYGDYFYEGLASDLD
jgi:hypothetical protein